MVKEKLRFEEDIMGSAVKAFLRTRFDRVMKELRIRVNDFPPPTRSVRLDFLAMGKTQSLVLECKRSSTPYYIGVGLGEVLMQRALLRREKSKIEDRESIQIHEPIRLGLCFSDFSLGYNKFSKGYRWKTWNQSCADLLSNLSKDLGESIEILLVKSKVVKPSYRDLLPRDIYVEKATSFIHV